MKIDLLLKDMLEERWCGLKLSRSVMDGLREALKFDVPGLDLTTQGVSPRRDVD